MAVRECNGCVPPGRRRRSLAVLFFFSTAWWSRQLLVRPTTLHKFAAEISEAVNVGDWALAGPMVYWCSCCCEALVEQQRNVLPDKTGGPVCFVASAACA